MADIYDVIATLCGFRQRVKHWPTVYIYWPLLKSNELIKDLPIVENEDPKIIPYDVAKKSQTSHCLIHSLKLGGSYKKSLRSSK